MSCRSYMVPEYALWGYLTYKADVYSFGVIALEIVARKNNMKYRPNENFVSLLDWVRNFSSCFESVRVLFFLAHRPKWKQGSWALYLLFGGLGLVHRS